MDALELGGPAELFQMEAIIPCVDCRCSCPQGEGTPGEARAPFHRETAVHPWQLGKPALSPAGHLGGAPRRHPVTSTARLQVAS